MVVRCRSEFFRGWAWARVLDGKEAERNEEKMERVRDGFRVWTVVTGLTFFFFNFFCKFTE